MKNFQKGIFIPLFGGLFCISPLYAKVTNLNNDWRFSLANDSTCTAPEYNDNEWRKLSIPHDWSIELPFDKNAPPEMTEAIFREEPVGIENISISLNFLPISLISYM